ncbi:MAG: winged helix-turn-helix transcriptional regulator [archaeon]|nr:winged helix-turn-helix transcriptional regulator [archaeon]
MIVATFSVSYLERQQTSDTSLAKHQQSSLLLSNASTFLSGASTTFQFSSSQNNQNENFSTRAMIMQYIIENPGVYLRETAEFLVLPLAVVQYHISVLEKTGQVQDSREGRYKRFFAAGVYNDTQQKVISLMRQSTPNKILKSLATSNSQSELSHVKLAKTLGITSQALTWQMNRLKAQGIVATTNIHCNGAAYKITEEANTFLLEYLGLVLIPSPSS